MTTPTTPPIKGRVLSPGSAVGDALVLAAPLSLWGGMDPANGELIDANHPQRGVSLAGRVVVMPAVRGSSSSSSVLAEAARAGCAPAALLIGEPDLILAVGSAVAAELYGIELPVLCLGRRELEGIPDGARVSIGPGGEVRLD